MNFSVSFHLDDVVKRVFVFYLWWKNAFYNCLFLLQKNPLFFNLFITSQQHNQWAKCNAQPHKITKLLQILIFDTLIM